MLTAVLNVASPAIITYRALTLLLHAFCEYKLLKYAMLLEVMYC